MNWRDKKDPEVIQNTFIQGCPPNFTLGGLGVVNQNFYGWESNSSFLSDNFAKI